MSELVWDKIEEIFSEAVELSGAEREAFLREKCGADKNLYRKIQSLIKADEKSDKYLEAPVSLPQTLSKIVASSADKAYTGQTFGVYRAIRKIGSGGMGAGRKITDIIEFCEKNGNKTNCRGLAIMLASLLRLNGVKAQHITCMPYEEPFEDCHVVVDCLLPAGKRIMLDPTWRLYLMDKNGEYISLPELRGLLIADEPFFANSSAGYNGTGFDKEFHRDYMTKNTFRFARCTMNKDGTDGRTETSRYIELIPKGYSTENFPEWRKPDFVYNDIEFWRI